MPTFIGIPFSSYFKRILQFGSSGNTGTSTSVVKVQSGDGVNTALGLCDDSLLVRPVNDNQTNTLSVQNADGTTIFAVDTVNSKILGSASLTALNTQYVYFGTSYVETSTTNFVADTHYAIPFTMGNFGAVAANYAMGSSTSSSFNDTNPATSLTISSTAMSIVRCYWHVMDNITIDAVKWWNAADTATGDETAAHLVSYSVDSANGSTSGDLSSGVVVADGATITNAGYEQLYKQDMTIQSADVDAGKIILFTFAADTVNADISINAVCKFHIR